MPKRHARTEKLSDDICTSSEPFKWNEKRSEVALALAQGYTWDDVIEDCQVSRGTISNWKKHPDFSAEVDRLSCMIDISSRAQRLRIAMNIIRQKIDRSDKDLLEWLKYAQGETDGVKLHLAALLEAQAPMADTGPKGPEPTRKSEQGEDSLAPTADASSGSGADRQGA
jgi:hypothetical protein